ncbi:hypothetical protein SUDANB6_03413 [Streptomyces sp. enrichment culture]|uniref:D-alanyl-D-alanine carboxypeptidase n=1 Tax=Streptomyces sp. enrichment culture TaxID=1795815 RepID=UPI003F556867
MAGESPDKSKQRESSARPASGSTGPVPEPRTESDDDRGARDPRPAAARDSAKPSAPAPSADEGEDGARGEADGPSGRTGKAGKAEGSPAEAGGTGKGRQEAGKAEEGREEAEKAGEGPGRAGKAGKGRAVGAGAPKGGTDADSGAPGDEDGRAGAGAATGGGDAGADGTGAGTAGEGTGGADAGAEAGGRSAEPPVDQPTAVFKAPRPSAPAVDQPTTMLRLDGTDIGQGKAEKTRRVEKTDGIGGTDKPRKDERQEKAGSAKPAATAGAARESDAERTSKFVALKPLDDPATRKPPRSDPAAAGAPAAEATAALPRTPADATAPVPQVGPERTTQQPLPPKPPLDLLAELTNTPPPPPTPLRTLARRVKIWTPLVLLLVIVFAVVQAVRPLPSPELELTAKDSYTFEGGKADIPWPSAGQAALDVQGIGTFGSSGEQKPVPIASVAKVMTAYVILRDHPLASGAEGPMIEIDQAAQDQGIEESDESKVKVYKGDKISQREALEGILIASANNVARLLARWDAGSEKAFVQKMNDAAEDLGMTNTTYTDPSGLNNTTVSTAVDQVKLAKEAMKSPAFREVAAMMSYVDYKGVTHPNWNQLVGFNNVVGIKTGTTSSALGNLVFAAKKEVGGETRTIVGAVVRQLPGGADNSILAGALSAGDKLIRAAQSALESRTILRKGDVVGYVDDGLGGRTPVVATRDVKAVGWAGLTVKLTFAAGDIPHTAAAGTEVGTLTVGDGGVSGAVKVPVALEEDLVEPGFTDKLTRIG